MAYAQLYCSQGPDFRCDGLCLLSVLRAGRRTASPA